MNSPSFQRVPLAPSIIDRDSDSTKANSHGYSIDMRQKLRRYGKRLKRDITNLLNSRNTNQFFFSIPPELKGTVIDYGVPDISSYSPSNSSYKQQLRNAILAILEEFEPRLQNIQVELLETIQASNPSSVDIRITGDVLIGVDTKKFEFDTQLDPQSHTFTTVKTIDEDAPLK